MAKCEGGWPTRWPKIVKDSKAKSQNASSHCTHQLCCLYDGTWWLKPKYCLLGFIWYCSQNLPSAANSKGDLAKDGPCCCYFTPSCRQPPWFLLIIAHTCLLCTWRIPISSSLTDGLQNTLAYPNTAQTLFNKSLKPCQLLHHSGTPINIIPYALHWHFFGKRQPTFAQIW